MWCNFEQSPVEDETISNAFSSRGIFKLRSDEDAQVYPSVQAIMQNKKMVISIDKSLVLLEDELVAKCSFLSFNAQIDVVAISPSGNLIVCGLGDGEVHGIFIKGVPLFSVCIKAEDVNMASKTFISIQQLENLFYITCSNGNVYCLSAIDETPLEANLNISIGENETVAFDKTIMDDVSIERVSTGRSTPGLTSGILINKLSESTLFIGSAEAILHFKSSTDNMTKLKVPERYAGVKRLYNLENYILLLTNSGHLLEVCPITRTVLFKTMLDDENLIDELIVMECSDDNIELLVLTKPIGNEGRQMRFLEYPSLKCNNQLDVSEHAWLVQQPKCSVNLYYLGGKNVNISHIPNEIEMLLVSETHPNERFKKLIAKGHLEEAEDFGKQFELSLQPIYEAKAKRILVALCNLDDNNIDLLERYFTELLVYLGKIESSAFFRNNRMINIPSRNFLEKYLKEILKHFDEEHDEDDINEITEQLHRLKTLAIIDPYECNMDWQKFIYNSNLVKMITTLFKTDIPTACLIWKRHAGAIMPKLSEKDLRKLLSLIPSNTEAFNLIQWLRQFVPTVSSAHPNIMPFLTEWSIQKTRSLQYSKHWPEIGLEFSTKVAEIFEDIQFLHSDVSRQHERNISKLGDLVNALQDLSVLKKSYNLSLTLDNYLQDSIEDTALCILQHVHLDNLKSLVNDFLYPIFQEKGSTPVAAIRRYISFLIANRNSLSTWLERAVSCIELLHCEIDRLECALSVLQTSPVPWSDAVAPLIKLRTSTHPLALKINAEYEMQVIKMMKVKYGWPADSAFDPKMLQLFMFRIVKMDLPDMIDDIRALTKAVPEISTGANFNCCYQMVRRGKIDEAYEFFKLLEQDKDKTYAADVRELFIKMLESAVVLGDSKSIEEQKRLIEITKLITQKSCLSGQRRLAAIQNSFVLRHSFQLPIGSIGDLANRANRLQYFDLGMENIIERSNASANVVKFITSELCALCKALELELFFGLHRICRRINCLALSCALTYSGLQLCHCTNENKHDFVLLALELIVQQIHASKRAQHACTTGMDITDPLAFPVIYELLVAAYLLEEKNPRDILEVLKYVQISSNSYPLNALDAYYNGRDREINESVCKALDAAEIVMSDSTLNFSASINQSFDVKPKPGKKRYSVSVFDEVEMQPQEPKRKSNINEQLHISRFVARTLLLIVTESEPKNEILLQLSKMLTVELRSDLDGAREEFFLSLEHLIKSKSHDIWYLMTQYLLDYQRISNCKKIINSDFVSLQLKRVFRNQMLNKDCNFTDLFAMLIEDKYAPTILEQLTNDMKTDQQRVNLLTLSEMYNLYVDELHNVDAIRTKRIKHYYYMEFCKLDPSIKGKFNADYDQIEQLLKEFHHKQLDAHLLERMSRDFALDYQKILITQVLSILNAQELQYEIKTDAFGDEELVVISTAESMRSLCEPYINEIKNIDLLTSKLKQFIEEINIYFYELYLCVIELLLFFDAMPKEMQIWKSILHFLKHKMITRRRNRPGQLETDMWLQSQKEIGVLPKIARYRLPFKPIVEQPLKDILDSELNVDNIRSWYPLIQMHTVLKGSKDILQTCDYYCMSAVKNSIAEYKASNESETWHLQPTNNAFLQSILRLVTHVHNRSKAFLILYFVSNYAPDGADQVEASYECFKYAIEHEAEITDQKCQEQLAKIKRKYPILKTQHLLYVYGLTDEHLMRLIENPTDLIYRLYHHELILKSSKLDINTVAKEIAELHNLDIEQLQFKLLHKWLSFTLDSADGTVCEETFFEDHNLVENTIDDAGSDAENVIRANYILNSWPKKKAVQFLVAHIFPSDGAVNTSKQLQMYECLTKLNDGSTSFHSMLSQRQYITIKCVHELKKLGYNFSLEKFADKNCNKIEILKTIWQRNAQNPHSLEIMANICLGFDIFLPKIWNGILKRMVMTNMVRELNALVEILSCRPQFLHTDGLVLAWECVLKHPFDNANQTRSFQQEEQLLKALFRIQGCPVLDSLNLLKIAEISVRLERLHMAAIIMALCQNEQQRKAIKQLITARKCDKLRKEILELEDAGILPVILNSALKELDL